MDDRQDEKNYNFSVFYENGTLIYKCGDEFFDKSLLGVIQALFFTSTSQFNYQISLIASEFSVLAYKAYTNKKNTILLTLIVPNMYADDDLGQLVLERTLDYIYYSLVMHIGKNDLYYNKTPTDLDKLKKLIETYDATFKYIIDNRHHLDLLLRSERKLEINKDHQYTVKHYMEGLKEKLKVDFAYLTVNDAIVWNNPEWIDIDVIDRILIGIIVKIYSSTNLCEIPLYFAKTTLEDDLTGKVSYKLIIASLYERKHIVFLGNYLINLDKVYKMFKTEHYDEFFYSVLGSLKIENNYGIEDIDVNSKCSVVINNETKTHKVMGSDLKEDLLSEFILNTCFTLYSLKPSMTSDEFYVKSDEYMFYFYRIAGAELNTYFLFDKNVSFEDVIETKNQIKNHKDRLKK